MKRIELDDIKDKRHPFKVPDGYFDELEQSILNATVDAEDGTRASAVFRLSQPWVWAAAASVVLVIAVALILGRSGEGSDDLLAGITDDEIMVYLATYDLSEYEIVGDLSSDQFESLFSEETILEGLEVDEDDLDDLMLEYEALDETLEI